MGQLFGTDGVRGVANKELDCKLAFELGRAGAYVLTRAVAKDRPRILVGRDTRISGDMLEAALVAGICSVGADVLEAGVVPTPAVAYLTRHYGADAGVVISASHNPVEYNGIKFFDSRGYKLPDELEERIESIILHSSEKIPSPLGEKIGRRVPVKDAPVDYLEFLKSTIDVDLQGLKLCVDCANGASSQIAPRLFRELGAKVHPICSCPDGTNINDNCGSTHPDQLQREVVRFGADAGLAFDGDADRLIAVDEKGGIVDGDHIIVICALDMMERGRLKKNTVVATVMSNMGMDIALKKAGCSVVKTKVGDRYVLERMLEEGYSIGGEQSGHVIFLDYNTTGDGLITALQLLSVMKRKGKKLSELASAVEKFPQVIVNSRVSNGKKKLYLEDPVIREEIRKIESEFNGNGRVLVRPSGTEAMIRVMIEGRDREKIERQARYLAKLIEERLA